MQLTFLDNKSDNDFSSYLKNGIISTEVIQLFQDLIHAYYSKHNRLFAWRITDNPYYIWVSEIMLQQTQTDRVKDKYSKFIEAFPRIESLAQAPLKEVLNLWQGLGYNRRAYALHATAQQIVKEYSSLIPHEPDILKSFKGIGAYTSCSIATFAYNKPTIFIETNIRSVFIKCFFSNKDTIHDKDIMPLIEQTLDYKNPRIWYYALMDYGVMLKKNYSNPNKQSAHYSKQSQFKGSNRQIRSAIIKLLINKDLSFESILEAVKESLYVEDQERVTLILQKLETEKLIIYQNLLYQLP